MASQKIRYLSSIISALKLACRFLPLAASTVRPRIPPARQADYDLGVEAVQAFCDLLLTTDYIDDNIGTN